MEFDHWLRHLKDPIARARIIARVLAAQYGNLGDSKVVSAGVSEMRIHCGPGYRIYYAQQGQVVILLLCAGDKSSQPRDIKQAKAILSELQRGHTP